MLPSKPDHPHSATALMQVHVLAPNEPNLTSPGYLDSAQTMDPVTPQFPPHVSARSSPESQTPSAPYHGVVWPHSGSTSSLQSALQPVATPARSRANTVDSDADYAPRAPIHPQIGDACPAGGTFLRQNPLVAGGAVLREIAQIAESASQACRMSQVRLANSLLEDLRSKISYVRDLISNFTLNDSPPHVNLFAESQDYWSYPRDQGITASAEERCFWMPRQEPPPTCLKTEPDDILLFPFLSPHPILQQSQRPSPSHTPTLPFNGTAHISSINGDSGHAEAMLNSVLPPTTTLPPHPSGSFWSEGVILTQHPSTVNDAPMDQMSRSGSINVKFGTPFTAMDHAKSYPTPAAYLREPCNFVPSTKSIRLRSQSVLDAHPTDSGEDSDDDKGDDDSSASLLAAGQSSALDHPASSSAGSSSVLQEYRQYVDHIFFQFLNRICSNLEARDRNGEVMHQTLAPKKMQRLAESPDFRPFTFRIMPFTNGFVDELARHGFRQEKIPLKMVRNYLWSHPYILRFNEHGNKLKSKGNHVWNVEAKRIGDSEWEFRPF